MVEPKTIPVKPKEATVSYGPVLTQVQPREEWITPTKGGTDRGKGKMKIATPHSLKCANGIDALCVSKDTIVLDGRGPC